VTWLEMLRDRNETSHIYDEKTAQRIFGHIKKNYTTLAHALNVLEKRGTDT